MTNGDYIRKVLTDETLTKKPKLLCVISCSVLRPEQIHHWDCKGCPFDEDALCLAENREELAEWLKAEREEEEE